MPAPAETVERYFDAWTSKDFETARSLLRDDMSFVGPFDTLDSADALIERIKGLTQILERAERRGLVAQGDEVCIRYDLETAPVGRAPIAEWYTVKEGKIAAMQAFFDARPFAPMFEN